MAGDLRVYSSTKGIGYAPQRYVIDAHSQKSGDFTEARNVDIQSKPGMTNQVYLTTGGAKAFDEAKPVLDLNQQNVYSEKDPQRSWLDFLTGSHPRGKESHVGTP